MRHAGIGFPENAGGEHPNRETIAAMPGIRDGCTLICSPSARYHYDFLRQRSPLVVWRAVPRQGKLPSQLNWDTRRVADEILNLWTEQPHYGREWFCPLNELQFDKEAGESWRGYGYMAARLSALRVELQDRFMAMGQDVRLMFPAWVPSDDGTYLDDWWAEAALWDAVTVHCYGSADTMRARYQSYRDAFPAMPLLIGEWNSNHEGHDERASLEMWADVAANDPQFLGACFYIWETNNEGERDLSIFGNRDREALFRDPPASVSSPSIEEPKPEPLPEPEPEPIPMTEYEAFCRSESPRRGIDPDVAVIVANSEGSLTEPARLGDFSGPPWYSGKSWWAFQLHYGGAGYEEWGGSAGMGNAFTAETGWAPGDPEAWRDAMRYALDAVRAYGWGAWYGAKARGITGFDGIDLNVPWSGTPSDEWDYQRQPAPAVFGRDDLARAIEAGRSRIGDPYVWGAEQPGGFDCSGFVKWCLGQIGIAVTSYTDAAYDECVEIPTTEDVAGDIIFYHYDDPGQPGVRIPHMGIWLGGGRTLEARYPDGVNEYVMLDRPWEIRRAPGVVIEAQPAEEEDMTRIEELEQRLRDTWGLIGEAYHPDGSVPRGIDNALSHAMPRSADTKAVLLKKLNDLLREIEAVRGFLDSNNPDRAA